MIIAIDGPSGTGKSTVARILADRLGCLYLDTGALYRLLALHFSVSHVDFSEEENLFKALENFTFDIQNLNQEYRYFLDNKDVTEAIRQPKISELASHISKNPCVREKLLPIQRGFAKKHSVVLEGRDIGTVVFPHAELKVFLTASAEIRADRRYNQLKNKFPQQMFDYQKILQEQRERDYQDETRTLAPLKQAPDAVFIDTTHLTIDQVVEKIIGLIKHHAAKHTTSIS
jgi:cytidylate kinase